MTIFQPLKFILIVLALMGTTYQSLALDLELDLDNHFLDKPENNQHLNTPNLYLNEPNQSLNTPLNNRLNAPPNKHLNAPHLNTQRLNNITSGRFSTEPPSILRENDCDHFGAQGCESMDRAFKQPSQINVWERKTIPEVK